MHGPARPAKRGPPGPGRNHTIRIGWKPSAPTEYAMYFNCNTNLVGTFRTLFPDLARAGNRALVFQVGDELPTDAVVRCVELALTYHLNKRKSGRVQRQSRNRPARKA